MFILVNVQHLEGSLDGRFGLVGIQSAGAEDFAVVVPGDDGLYQRIGSSARWDSNGVVLQNGESTVEILLIDVSQRLHEGVVLTIASSAGLILLAINLYFDISTRLKSVSR